MPRLRAMSSRIPSESVLPPREQVWLRVALVGAPVVALIGAVVSLALSPAIRPGLILAGLVLPTVIVTLLGAAIWRRTFLFAAAVAINVEALVAGAVLPDGMAVAVVAPLISVALIQGSLDSAQLRLASIAAVVVASVSVALAVLVGPAHVLFMGTATGITIASFTALIAFALALGWRATTSLRPALDASQSEIAARNAAEARLERTSTLLSAIVDASPLATQAFTLDRTVTIWNPASERIFGWTADELIGRPMPSAMIPDDERVTAAERISRTIAGEVARGERVRRLTKDGREVWVEIYGSVLRDGQGHPLGLAGQLADVTERVALDAQLAHAERLEAIGRVAGGIAHDFNNTLTAIGGFATLIADETTDPDAVRADAATIVDVVDRSRQLTRQLLAFARRTTLEPAVVDIRTTVHTLEPMLHRLLGDVVVDIRQPADPLVTRVDAGQLEQAVDQPRRQRARCDARRRVGHRRDPPRAPVPRGHRGRPCGRRTVRGRLRVRHRHRHDGRRAGSRVRAVLHDQGGRPRHRARARDGARLHPPVRRPRPARVGAGRRDHGRAPAARAGWRAGRRARRRRSRREAPRDASRSWWSTTSPRSRRSPGGRWRTSATRCASSTP